MLLESSMLLSQKATANIYIHKCMLSLKAPQFLVDTSGSSFSTIVAWRTSKGPGLKPRDPGATGRPLRGGETGGTGG